MKPQRLLIIGLTALFMAGDVYGNGEIGEHVKQLKMHIDEYTDEIHWFNRKVNDIVETYGHNGATEIQPDEIIDYWEAIKFHAAIETTYVPIYAAIWQRISGVQKAIWDGQPIAVTREQQAALERALWQGLGAVKMAAQQQYAKTAAVDSYSTPTNPAVTLEEIQGNLEEVLAKVAEQQWGQALALVHITYADHFEGIEGQLIEQDADLVENLEMDFNITLPQALDGGTSIEVIRKIVSAMQDKLHRAGTLLAEAQLNPEDVF
ncbi:MAG: hypothetical protein EP324_00860 [Gammaproteobacteria bacterium]|nr:MAG: hypothetical protein EP334_10395 [Gammaproteobacteria bacterium]TNE95055.1 MAG: hypothetical protein EP324_00860 [Gammaproteobacteria bacterium]